MSAPALNLSLKNNLAEFPLIAEAIEAYGKSRNWSKNWIMNITLSLDELITNIISYGYQDSEKHQIHITLTEQDGSLIVVLEDDGISFNPLSDVPKPDLEADIEERHIGGLGVYFARSLMDEISYERRGTHNRLTLTQFAPS